MKRLPYPHIQKLVERLEVVLPEMLIFLDSLAQPLANWQACADDTSSFSSGLLIFKPVWRASGG